MKIFNKPEHFKIVVYLLNKDNKKITNKKNYEKNC